MIYSIVSFLFQNRNYFYYFCIAWQKLLEKIKPTKWSFKKVIKETQGKKRRKIDLRRWCAALSSFGKREVTSTRKFVAWVLFRFVFAVHWGFVSAWIGLILSFVPASVVQRGQSLTSEEDQFKHRHVMSETGRAPAARAVLQQCLQARLQVKPAEELSEAQFVQVRTGDRFMVFICRTWSADTMFSCVFSLTCE